MVATTAFVKNEVALVGYFTYLQKMTHKQRDVEFPEVPTLVTREGMSPSSKRLLERHHPAAYAQYQSYLGSWQSYLRANRKFLRAVNRATWDVPGHSARCINGFPYGNAAVFFEDHFKRWL